MKTKEFERKFFNSENNITFIGTGSMGGKAQSLFDINNLISENFSIQDFPGIEVNIPRLTVLRTDVFDSFMTKNNLYKIAYSDLSDDRIASIFQEASLPFEILGDLRALISQVHSPLAIRSSSMLEDAMHEPFAGIYGTKMTPNNQFDTDTRFRKLIEAIKFVYASTFFKEAKEYIKVTKHNTSDEKMAVIIQEVVGNRYSDFFYPEISGVARSYNFFPMAPSKQEDGVVNLAFGLGKTIVDGGKAWAFSPSFPKANLPFGSIRELLQETQTEFWSVNMGEPPAYDPINEAEFVIKKDITIGKKHKSLRYIASSYDPQSDSIVDGINENAPLLLNFSPLLVYNEIEINNLIKSLLTICEKAMEAPVEIEFAISLSKDRKKAHRFGFLQVRPMVVSTEEVTINEEEFIGKDVLLSSDSVLGNGIYKNIRDIVFVKPEMFNAKETKDIAAELEPINSKLVSQGRPYLLIGFGRWGSSDPWMSIPVTWAQISGAKTIVETNLENMHVEFSQGSHFFHNITSFNVSYFSIPYSKDFTIDWDWLNNQELKESTKYIKHVQLPKTLNIKVDGRKGTGLIKKS